MDKLKSKTLDKIISNVPPLQVMTLTELREKDFPETEWLVDRLLPMGGLSILSGKPKAGKSTLVQSLIKNVLEEKDFLGRSCAGGSVLYCAFEELLPHLKSRLSVVTPQSPNELYVLSKRTNSPLKVFASAINNFSIEHPNIRLIILDTFGKAIGETDLNDYSKAQTRMGIICDLARELPWLHIMVVHHNRKGDSTGGDDILGSAAIFGGVDCALMIDRDSGNARYLRSSNRYGEDLPKTRIHYDESLLDFSLGDKITEESLQSLVIKILDLLHIEESLDFALIREKIGAGDNRIREALGSLLKSQKIEKSGFGKRGSPLIYSLRKTTLPNSLLKEPVEKREIFEDFHKEFKK